MLLPGAVKGKGRVEALKENIGLGIALQAFAARFFGGGSQVAGIIEFPGNLAKEQAKALADGFDSRHGGYRKAHRTGVLSGGAKYTKVGSTPEESQMLESRNMAVVDIARMFQIPPHLLGVPGYNSHASVEQMTQDFVTYTLRPFVEKIEVGYSTLLPGGAYLKWNLDGLIRADFQTRMSAYSTANQTGWLSLNDIRRLEDFAPIDGGDVYRVPLANVNLNAADLSAQEAKVAMAQKLIQVGFDPASVLAQLGLPAMTHTGVPSAQLQQVALIDPENPSSVY
jgi:HK97 family phage portal protein